MPPAAQIALLRVLQERTFDRVGGSKPVGVDVRVIAATNRDLDKSIADGSFRDDLCYRLSVFPIHAPPLRDRSGDIPLLVQYLTQRYAANVGKKIRNVSRRTMLGIPRSTLESRIRSLRIDKNRFRSSR